MSNGLRIAFTSLVLTATLASFLLLPSLKISACPFCDAPTTTLSEQLSTSHVAVLVRWESAVKPDPNDFAEGTTTYKVIESAGAAAAEHPPGSKFTVNRYNFGTPGDEGLIFATLDEEKIAWGLPSPVSRECWTYLITAPARDLPVRERLPFYLRHLEHEDPDIAMDAYSEFAGIPYEDLKLITDLLPREKIIECLKNPLTIPTRKGLFGLMLGLCGTPEDAKYMKEVISEQPEDSRMGIDGMMGGYLLLTGNDGLADLTRLKLDDEKTPEHEIYSLLKALEFMWTYGQEKVDADKLRVALRKILHRPQLSGLVILDLARWQDWEVMDTLAASYGQEPFADRHPRQCIVRYLIVAEKDAPEGTTINSDGKPVDYRSKARTYLNKLRADDPATVKYVEKYPFD
ncbi:hypothetical protein SH661x_001402 [Planctomicrobium sp. SH661]|uniref:hypothetical protein n=1 Tax=Planctomicrobium sp. SH661 TaxID=3448124 RepID=UPI003F5CA1EC